MKFLRFLPFALFALCLTAGFLAGRALHTTPPAAGPAAFNALPTLPSGQRQVLVIFVDDLQKSPARLRSLSLLAYSPSFSRMLVLPIYPSPRGDRSPLANRIPTQLHLPTNGALDDSLVNILRQQNIAWDGYFAFDETALALALEGVGGVPDPVNGEVFSIEPLLAHGEPVALKTQSNLLYGLCARLSDLPTVQTAVELPAPFAAHLRADFNLPLAVAEWLHWLGPNGGLTCDLSAYFSQ